MATFWTGSASAVDYGHLGNMRIQAGYGSLNRAIDRAVLAQFDEPSISVCVDEDDSVMHCGYLECHHDVALHEFDVAPL